MILLAAFSGDALIHAVIWIIIAGIIFWLLTWLISYAGVPDPFAKVARIVLAIVAVLILTNALLGIAGHPFIVW
jgi:hypothetical protein